MHSSRTPTTSAVSTIEAEADRDTENDLEAIRFAVTVEIDDEMLAAIIEHMNALCHVHDALRDELHADVTIRRNTF